MSRKKTHVEFVAELKKIHGDDYEVISTYEGCDKEITIKHICGCEFTTKPGNIKKVQSLCPACRINTTKKTHEEFIRDMATKMPSIEVLGHYESSKTKIEVKCKTCGHVWHSKPSNLLSGFGCPSCAGNIKRTHEEFVKEIDDIFHGEYKILTEYSNLLNKVEVLHLTCGKTFSATAGSLLSKHGCPYCNGGRRITHDEFVHRLKNKYGDKFFILSNFETCDDDIRVKAIKCGHEFTRKARDLLADGHCPVCYEEKIKNSQIQNRQLLRENLGDEYEIIDDFKNFKTKIKFRHIPCGHVYEYYPGSIIKNGHRCGFCYKSKNAKSHDIFKQQVLERCGDKVMVLGEYKDTHTPIKVRHNICETEYDVMPNTLLKGSINSLGCPSCYRRVAGIHKRLPINRYKEATERLGFIFVDVIYQNKELNIPRSIIKYICPKHPEEGVQETSSDRIFSGKICGCKKCRLTKGEMRISEYFKSQNIPYIDQQKFQDLRGVNGGLLSYDFYIPDYNLLIEFQGQQHENAAPFFGGDEHSTWNFKKQQEHDKRKREYAKNNQYNLLEIWYKDINNIDSILDEELKSLNELKAVS